jgi:uncharacterized cupin superfamily protein
MSDTPIALRALDVPVRQRPSIYPEPFARRVAGRERRALGDFFGLKNFGVNLTRLPPGCQSALLHRHKTQDELIYIVAGEPTLVTDRGEMALSPGMCAGFPAQGTAHHLVNRSTADVLYFEIGDRSPGDEGIYPNDDLKLTTASDGRPLLTHKDGRPY